MKKLLTAVAVLGVATLAFGQGQINFANSATTLISVNGGGLSGTTGTAKADGTVGYSYGVWWGAVGNMDASTYTFVAYGTNLPSAGRLNGGNFVISGQAAGTSVQALVRGWNSALGYQGFNGTAPTTAQNVMGYVANPASAAAIPAVAAAGGFWYGQSAIGTFVVGGGAQPIPALFASPVIPPSQNIASGFTLNYVPVPEPSTLALAGLGAAALLVFRRRK